MFSKSIYLLSIILISYLLACGQLSTTQNEFVLKQKKIIVGAKKTNEYLPLLVNERVAVVANQTSLINKTHIVDSLISLNINVKKVFSPEHGFRGNAEAGESVENSIDKKTGLKIISLYGDHKKPTKEDLEDINVLVFDLQDVGTRFYTYLSTLHLCMEACAENNKKLILLDRPNPNGNYIDGPILEPQYTSFVGMDPIPIVYGMTLGEYAKMLNGEHWLKDSLECDLDVITVDNYTHNTIYTLPIAPSPNLPNLIAVKEYPSLCLFEGTQISVGRGTKTPFQIYGHPDFNNYDTTFTPQNSVQAKKECKGYSLIKPSNDYSNISNINLSYLIEAYNQLGKPKDFFNSFFNKLAGTDKLQNQIKKGLSENEIKASWQDGLTKFKTIRNKYLLYPDFK